MTHLEIRSSNCLASILQCQHKPKLIAYFLLNAIKYHKSFGKYGYLYLQHEESVFPLNYAWNVCINVNIGKTKLSPKSVIIASQQSDRFI